MELVETRRGAEFSYLAPLIAGGLAGLSVDITLYPIDTIKTRLQSEQGFYKAGGFHGIYRGLGAVVTGSMPTSALFFTSYEVVKNAVEPLVDQKYAPMVHMLAASIGEVVACLIRVPTEVVKQRKQTYTGIQRRSNLSILRDAFRTEGLRRGVYRGFFSTVMRDLPFSFIEMPVWEYLKYQVRDRNGGKITSVQSALCGSIAGGLAGAITTPLDLAKTRIMLAEDYTITRKLHIKPVLADIYRESGVRGLFAGLLPRVMAFTLGGFVFFGAYDYAKQFCGVVLEK